MFHREVKAWSLRAQYLAQRMAMIIVVVSALVAACASLGAAADVLPWLPLSADLAGETVHLGAPVQLAATVFLLGLIAYLPSSARVMALERTHRDFRTSMEDVARAYYAAHAADRSGAFRIKSEYDATRERLEFLHKHPDLMNLKPEMLELAAKMSFIARDLAQVYADERVLEVKSCLQDRQSECVRLEADIERALAAIQELRELNNAVGADEQRIALRMDMLKEELLAVMTLVGIDAHVHERRTRLAAE